MIDPTALEGPRLRQVALVVADLGAATVEMADRLGVAEPFADPGVGHFGLRNAVYAVGDTFIELVSPAEPGTSAGRQRDRIGGDGGYMVLIQVPDTDAARRRAADLDMRVVWSADLPEISGTHLHPRDTGGALLSFDTPRPPASWLWGGPAWEQRQGDGRTTRLVGATIACADPAATSARWAALLGAAPPAGERVTLVDSDLTFVAAAGGPEGLVGIRVDASGGDVSPGPLLGCELTVS
ncbi:MAG: hypothetical protein NVS3B21_04470 [Acidimicrobiales bacterium]